MGAPSKRAKRIRQASEFGSLSRAISPPKSSPSVYAWNLADIQAARDEQMRGRFLRAARLAESMRTDDALYVARANRLAPQRSIEVAMVPAKGARGQSIASEADALFGAAGVGILPETIADIHGCLVDHGISFALTTATPREDGSRVDLSVSAWPIEFVRWDSTEGVFKTRIEDGAEETIVHGDGRWTIFCKNEIEPFKHGALLPAALVWARHAFAIRDWAKGSVAHGNAKIIGEMPEGVPMQNENGTTEEAAAFMQLLEAVCYSDAGVGIRPAGSKTDYLVNGSTAWQVFDNLVQNAEKAAARVYLGTDGTLGAQGGAPGVDIQALFGVAATIVEGDLECLERGFKSGVIEPWTALNFGDSSLAPTRAYLLPDPDEHARRMNLAERRVKFFEDMLAARDAGFELTDEYVATIAAEYGIEAPKLPVKPAAAPAPAVVEAPAAPALRRVT
jgi:hypothetical protein